MLSYAEAAIISTILQAILTGVQFTTFHLCLRWQIYSDDGWSIRKNIQWPMSIITLLIMAFSLINLGGTVQTVLIGLKGDNYLSTSLIAVCDLAVQNCRHLSEVAPAHTGRKGFSGNCCRRRHGS